MIPERKILLLLASAKPEAYLYRVVNVTHRALVKVSHLFLQPLFVYRPHLLEQYHAILTQSRTRAGNVDMRGQTCLTHSRRYCRRDYSGAVFVANVVLDYKHRPQSPLLTTYNRAQISIINISALYVHFKFREKSFPLLLFLLSYLFLPDATHFKRPRAGKCAFFFCFRNPAPLSIYEMSCILSVNLEKQLTLLYELLYNYYVFISSERMELMKEKLNRFFKISERGSTIKTEIVAGLTTFFAMAYIVVTNPNQVVGFNFGGDFSTIWNAVYVASILVAVIGTLLYAFYAKMPFAQACGMGLNSFFFVAFIAPEIAGGDVVAGYREGLCIILLSGVLFLVLSLTGARQYIAKALPDCLKKAIPAGIGLFIAFIGFKNVGIIQENMYTFVQFFDFNGMIDAVGMSYGELIAGNATGAVSDAVLASYSSYFGNPDVLTNPEALKIVVSGFDAWCIMAPVVIALLGLFAIAVLEKKNVKGSVIIAIAGATVLYYIATWQLPSFELGQIGQSFVDFGSIGIFGAFEGFTIFAGGIGAIVNAIVLTITFTLVDMFDTIGTLYGTASQADMLDENGDPIEVNKCMSCDSVATVSGALLGTSTCTTFVESASGVAVGGRTGLTSLVTAACFFLCLFLSPVAAIVPACATAPALIYVGVLMLKGFAKVDMSDITAAVPSFLALVMMPLTYSISNGIAIGAIAYTIITLVTGKYSKKDIVVTAIAILFTVRFFLVSM